MLLASLLMLRPIPLQDGPAHTPRESWKVVTDGLLVGMVTGLVGVGGGFLIVPALVLLGGLPMHSAVATSLVIIALKSYSGFWKYLDVLEREGLSLDWSAIALVTALGIAGSIVGNRIAGRMPQRKLQITFGAFLVVMGAYILIRSLPAAIGL